MASTSHVPRGQSSGLAGVKARENAVSIALPAEGFAEVARLVTGGFLSGLGAGYEVIDNLQLAVELLLRALPVQAGQARVALVSNDGELTITVSGLSGEALEERLHTRLQEGLDLASVLAALVDSLALADGSSAGVVLRKRLEAAAV